MSAIKPDQNAWFKKQLFFHRVVTFALARARGRMVVCDAGEAPDLSTARLDSIARNGEWYAYLEEDEEDS